MFFRKHIFERVDERLILRGVSAQPVAADSIGLQIHLGSDQSVDPMRIHFPAMAQHPDGSGVIRPAQVNDSAAGPLLQIQPPRFWKRPALGRLVVTGGAALLVSGHEPVAGRLESRRAGVVKTLPDFLLPQIVEAFIEILGPMLARGRKDGRDAQRQATADDLAQHIGMSVCSLEARVVVGAETEPLAGSVSAGQVGTATLLDPPLPPVPPFPPMPVPPPEPATGASG